MGLREVYGNTVSENGWPMVDQGSCQWITVPGTSVSLQIQQGWPAALLGAWAADHNAFVEPLRDADSACWTVTNSVPTSNHLSGTACDLNWQSHPFQVPDAGFSPAQVATIREMLAFYEGTIFWGNDWDSPKDAMHVQCGYNTYQNPHTADFIARKIRPDGLSTFRRAVPIPAPAPPPAPPIVSPDRVAVLAAATGLSIAKAAEILPALAAGLKLAQCDTVNRIAMALAQWGWESAEFSTTQEFGGGNGKAYYPYCGRTWIQITWQSNYAAFGQWCHSQGLIDDPNQFVNDPASLSDIRWAGIGSAWYWVVERPNINALCDAGDINGVTYAINGGYNGLDSPNGGRRALWNRALAQGDALLSLIGDDDEMAGWTQDLVDRAMVLLENQTGIFRPSLSRFRHVGEGNINTCGGFAWTADANVHEFATAQFATEYGDPQSIILLWEVARNTDPDRAQDAKLAERVLSKVSKADLDNADKSLQAWLAAEAKP